MFALQQQFDILKEEILRDKSSAVEGDWDSLFSDAALLRAIKAAEHRFARRTLLLVRNDYEVQTAESVADYELPVHIIAVAALRRADKTYVQRTGGSLLGLTDARTSYTAAESWAVAGDSDPVAFATDELSVADTGVAVTLTVYPAPAAAYVQLYTARVVVVPDYEYTKSDMKRNSIIPELYQFGVLCGAAAQLLKTDDRDAGDFRKAGAFEGEFEKVVREAQQHRILSMALSAGFDHSASPFK